MKAEELYREILSVQNSVENGFCWRKLHGVADALQVALETTLPAGAEPVYLEEVIPPPVSELEKGGMIHRAKVVEDSRIIGQPGGAETVDRWYSPRVGPVADLRKPVRKVAFKAHIKNGLFKRIVLRRRADQGERTPEMYCGRAVEAEPEHQDKAFGFSAERNVKRSYFVSLAYPGKTPEFEPLFIKVVDAGERFIPYYLLVKVHDEKVHDEADVVMVEVAEVDEKKVPAFLRDHR